MAGDVLTAWATQNVMLILLAFARIGTALILMPGFGETRVPPRAKIALGFLISLCMMAALPLPEVPDKPSLVVILFACEALIGAFLAMCVRIFFVALHVLGGIIGYASGLSNAFAPPDANFEGASTVAALMHISMVALVFVSDTHHLILDGIMRSYQIIPPGEVMIADMTEQLARMGSSAFYIALMVGAPFVIFTILMNLAMGLANRVMPTMQVFFVAGPGLIILGMALFAVTAPSILENVLGEMADWLIALER